MCTVEQIQFLIPKGGEIWNAKETYNIYFKFSVQNAPSAVTLTLFNADEQGENLGQVSQTLVRTQPGLFHTADFTVPDWVPTGDHYYLKLNGTNAAGNSVVGVGPTFAIRNPVSTGGCMIIAKVRVPLTLYISRVRYHDRLAEPANPLDGRRGESCSLAIL